MEEGAYDLLPVNQQNVKVSALSSLASFAVAVVFAVRAAIFGILHHWWFADLRPRPTPPSSNSARQQQGGIFLVHHQPEAACNIRCEVFQQKFSGQSQRELFEVIDIEAALQTVLEMLQNGEVIRCTILSRGSVKSTSAS